MLRCGWVSLTIYHLGQRKIYPMENFIIIITFLLLGVALKRTPAFSDETGNVLYLIVIYISLPALILLKIPALVFSKGLLVPAIMPKGKLISLFLLSKVA